MGRLCRVPLPAFAQQCLWSGKRFSGQAAVSRQQGIFIFHEIFAAYINYTARRHGLSGVKNNTGVCS